MVQNTYVELYKKQRSIVDDAISKVFDRKAISEKQFNLLQRLDLLNFFGLAGIKEINIIGETPVHYINCTINIKY